MKFKELEIEQDRGARKLFKSRQLKRTLLAIFIGAVAGFAYYYFTEGKHMELIPMADILKSLGLGGFFGLFVTNSPCARGRC